MKDKRAFTLIELLVVVAILAVLMAIAIPRFSKVSDNAQVTADEANHRVLKSAAAAYVSAGGGATSWTKTGGGWEGYIEEWPDYPKGEGEYKVTIGENGDITITPDLLKEKTSSNGE